MVPDLAVDGVQDDTAHQVVCEDEVHLVVVLFACESEVDDLALDEFSVDLGLLDLGLGWVEESFGFVEVDEEFGLEIRFDCE